MNLTWILCIKNFNEIVRGRNLRCAASCNKEQEFEKQGFFTQASLHCISIQYFLPYRFGLAQMSSNVESAKLCVTRNVKRE